MIMCSQGGRFASLTLWLASFLMRSQRDFLDQKKLRDRI